MGPILRGAGRGAGLLLACTAWLADGRGFAVAAPPSAVVAPGYPVGVDQERLIAGPFWVDAVSWSDRSVVVHGPDGLQITVNVSADAAGFGDLEPGDRIEIEYLRSSAVALRPALGTSTELMQAPPHPSDPPARQQATSGDAASACPVRK